MRRGLAVAQVRGIVAAAGLSLVAAFALTGNAEARTFRHHHRAHHRIVLVQVHRQRPFIWPTRAAGGDSVVLATARRFLGRRNPTGFRGPWCGAFLGMIAKIRGLNVPEGFRRALAWLRAGPHVSRPRPGDVAVMPGHATIYVGRRGWCFRGLGGNQRHGRVAISSFPVHRVIAWVRLR